MTNGRDESLKDRLDRIGAEAEAGEADQTERPIPEDVTVTSGRGLLGKDFLGGQDPVDFVREQRDGGGYIPTSSDQETVDLARELMQADEGRVAAPVKFEVDEYDMATLTFGPMRIDDLDSMLSYLGTPEGSASFRESLEAALLEKARLTKGG